MALRSPRAPTTGRSPFTLGPPLQSASRKSLPRPIADREDRVARRRWCHEGASRTAIPMAPEAEQGTYGGRFRSVRALKTGPGGVTLFGTDLTDGAPVVIRTVGGPDTPAGKVRFEREAAALGRLRGSPGSLPKGPLPLERFPGGGAGPGPRCRRRGRRRPARCPPGPRRWRRRLSVRPGRVVPGVGTRGPPRSGRGGEDARPPSAGPGRPSVQRRGGNARGDDAGRPVPGDRVPGCPRRPGRDHGAARRGRLRA